jgi:predicted RNase H-like HicB family nuclease
MMEKINTFEIVKELYRQGKTVEEILQEIKDKYGLKTFTKGEVELIIEFIKE